MNKTEQRTLWHSAYSNAYEPKRVSGETVGPCPVCGGKDRFWIRENGSFGCRGCEPSGSNPEAGKKIIAALNDLAGIETNGQSKTAKKWKIIRSHEYRDRAGNIQVRHVKGIPPDKKKATFFWQHPIGNNRWGRGMGIHGLQHLLYARDRLKPAVKNVVILEGEKDADTAHNLIGSDNPTWAFISGGGGCHNPALDWEYLSGAERVIVVFDGDSPGRKGVEKYIEHGANSGHLPGVEFSGYAEEGENGRDITDIYKQFGVTGVEKWFKHIKKLPVQAVGTTPTDLIGHDILTQIKEFGIKVLPEQLVADWFIHVHSDRFRYDVDRDRWLHLADDGIWTSGETEVFRAISDLLIEHCEVVRGYGSKGYLGSLKTMGNASMRKNVLYLMSSATNCMHTESSDWDSDPELIGTQNGVWNLRTLKKLDTQEAIRAMVTKRTEVSPDTKDGGETDRFEQFLVEVCSGDLDMASFLLDYLGYMLTGYTHEEKFLFIHGRSNNGKSVLLRLVDYVMGEYAHVVPQDEFEKKQSSRHPTHETQLDGMRGILLDEQKNVRWDEARLKNVVSGGKITAHKMGKDFYTFRSHSKLLIAANQMPRFSADSAMEKRLLAMNFRFQPDEDKMDKDLSKKFEEIGGRILWRLMRSAQNYLKHHRLDTPSKVQSEANRVMMSADPIKAYFVENYEVTGSEFDKVAKKDMIGNYDLWVEEHGFTAGKGKGQGVARRLKELCVELEPDGIYSAKSGRSWYWHGLKQIT